MFKVKRLWCKAGVCPNPHSVPCSNERFMIYAKQWVLN